MIGMTHATGAETRGNDDHTATHSMRWTSALSRNANLEQAVHEVSSTALADLGGPPDLTFVFVSDHHRSGFDSLPARLLLHLGGGSLIGCSASGVIGDDKEVEFQPSLSLISARLPDAALDAWHIDVGDLGPGTAHSDRCAALAWHVGAEPAQFIILADPFTFPAEQLLHSLEAGFPSAVIAGGLASGTQAPGETALFLNDTTHRSGALILSLAGNLEMGTAVAQGCRPIGDPMFITALDGSAILELDGQSPLQLLNRLYVGSDEQDRALMQHALFMGVAMRPEDTEYDRGDFLIRNLVGADQESGAIGVAAELYIKQVVQFHLRDAETSASDLDQVLTRTRDSYRPAPPAGAVIFSCTGRGEGLYGRSGHDSATFHRLLGRVPLGGFFCNGEIGPVEGKTFLHGYTSAFALFRPRHD
jgi:small ligand-binding sensory domain FIST